MNTYIKSITTITIGYGHFECQKALVEIGTGQEYVYSFEFSDSWTDLDDYLDNVRSDFENEYDNDNSFGEEEMGLFIKREILEV
jgi:hypothetical protein